ncbi:hypothetical protein MIR68_000858 [Amoeboaphelidium protococcarum]|nr:hypothetical protein MIR68_000858 [Amoeboaphelidium protococcarum]
MIVQDLLSYQLPAIIQDPVNNSQSTTPHPENTRILDDVNMTVWDSFDEDVIDPFNTYVADKLQLECKDPLAHLSIPDIDKEVSVWFISQSCFTIADELAKVLNLNVILGYDPKKVVLRPNWVFFRRLEDMKGIYNIVKIQQGSPLMTGQVNISLALDDGMDLVTIANDDQQELYNDIRRIISQEYSYMTVNNHRYGVICTNKKVYFLRRGGPDEQRPYHQLQFSKAVPVDQVTPYNFITALTAMYFECSNNHHLQSSPCNPTPSIEFDPAIRIEVPVHNLYFDALMEGSEQFSVVKAGFRQPLDTVLKMVDTRYDITESQSDSAQIYSDVASDGENSKQVQQKGPRLLSLEREHQCYLILKEYWGLYLPVLHARLSLDNWIECIMIDELEKPTREDFDEQDDHLRDALDAIYDKGVAHNDVAERNIMKDKKTGRLMFIDFAYSRLLEDDPEKFKIARMEDGLRLEFAIKGETYG